MWKSRLPQTTQECVCPHLGYQPSLLMITTAPPFLYMPNRVCTTTQHVRSAAIPLPSSARMNGAKRPSAARQQGQAACAISGTLEGGSRMDSGRCRWLTTWHPRWCEFADWRCSAGKTRLRRNEQQSLQRHRVAWGVVLRRQRESHTSRRPLLAHESFLFSMHRDIAPNLSCTCQYALPHLQACQMTNKRSLASLAWQGKHLRYES